MSEMGERVARALFMRAHPRESVEPNSQLWHSFLGQAEVAIEAMREPTDAMVEEGAGRGNVRVTWSMMIDEALK